MKIPQTIRISGTDYPIIETAKLNNGTEMCYGRIDYEKSLIEINPDNQTHQHKCTTMLHEILHGVSHHCNLTIENEEHVIDTLAKGLYQVLQDNAGALFDLASSRETAPTNRNEDSREADKNAKEVTEKS